MGSLIALFSFALLCFLFSFLRFTHQNFLLLA